MNKIGHEANSVYQSAFVANSTVKLSPESGNLHGRNQSIGLVICVAMIDPDIRALAIQTFADVQKADAWLRRPLAQLDKATPLEVATTRDGVELVKNVLGKIAWGAAA